MAKIIAAINQSIDGFCDHTVGIADEELHQHYTELLHHGGAILYGRITYHLMEAFWPALAAHPSGHKDLDDFAVAIDTIPKIVFSETLQHVSWRHSELKNGHLEEEVLKLREQASNEILIGSPSLISQLTTSGLIDEFQLCVHPVIAGSGLQLFKNITKNTRLDLIKTKHFNSGAILLTYIPHRNAEE